MRLAVILIAIFAVRSVVAADTVRPWDDYRVVMWIGESAERKPALLPIFYQRLREMGVNTAMVHHAGPSEALLKSGMPFYVENMVNKGLCLKWNSKVKDWNAHVTAWKDERGEAELVREYSFDDPAWKKYARDEMQRLVRINREHNPLAYDIRDELSVTMSANPFDYDFSPVALDGFRAWLTTQYKDLAALNAQWDTDFAKWEDVRPFTTDQIKNRMAGGRGAGKDGAGLPRGKPDWQALQKVTFDPAEARKDPLRWNFSPWCDHRTYMDLSLARTLGDLRAAARELDPRTPVGIEGTQMPSAFGGYDLWRLSQALDWVEPYDIGNAREIFGSFMPGKPILSTVGEQDARAAQRRLWHLLLEGDKGCIIWWSEDCIDWKSDDYALTPRAAALAPVLKELQSPLAQLFLRAEREVDPIAIHYSQASIQVNWLLESTVDGSTWLRRFSSYEATHNRMAQRRQAWVKALQDFGYTPRFISSEQIERGELKDVQVLVLPDSVAISAAEQSAIDSFIDLPKARHWVWGGSCAGVFDSRGKSRDSASLISVDSANWHSSWILGPLPDTDHRPFRSRGLGPLAGLGPDMLGYLQTRTKPPLPRDYELRLLDLERQLPRAVSIAPTGASAKTWPKAQWPVDLPSSSHDSTLAVRTHRYKLNGARLFAFERNIVWQMGEDLKQRGGNEALEKPVTFDAKLAKAAHVYDLRAQKYLGMTDSIRVDLDPWKPSLYALSETKLSDDDVVGQLAKLPPAQR